MQRFKVIVFVAVLMLIAGNSNAADLWAVVKGNILDYSHNIEMTNVYTIGGAGYSGLYSSGAANYYATESDRQLEELKTSGAKCKSEYYAIDHYECLPAAYPNGATLVACTGNIVCLNKTYQSDAPKNSTKKK